MNSGTKGAANHIPDHGKVERSHRTDEQEFYQLLTYIDDIDLDAKLSQWEHFYNLSRPHGAFNGKAPYEVLRERLEIGSGMSHNRAGITV